MKVTARAYCHTDSPQMMTKAPTKKRRQRREIPENLAKICLAKGSGPTSLDVITRGGDYQNTFEKNERYWRRILSERKSYTTLGKYEHEARSAIVESIYDYILSTGGRFLQLDVKSGQWFQLSKIASMHEIQKALNERYVPYFARAKSTKPKTSRPDTSAFTAFLKASSLATTAKSSQTSNFFRNYKQSIPSPVDSINFMACIESQGNEAYLQQVPQCMNTFLEDQMNSAFPTALNNSNSSLVEAI